MSIDNTGDRSTPERRLLDRPTILLGSTTFAAASAMSSSLRTAQAQQQPSTASGNKPNILVIFGDDIGQTNISAYSFGVVGYNTPNIDRIAKEGMMFTDYYAENSCTAGRSSFITGQTPKRTGLTKVGIPGAPIGLQARDITIAQALKPLGYATGQFGKNHLGDRNEFCQRFTASTSFLAIFTTSMPRRSRSDLIGQRTTSNISITTRRAACSAVRRPTGTI